MLNYASFRNKIETLGHLRLDGPRSPVKRYVYLEWWRSRLRVKGTRALVVNYSYNDAQRFIACQQLEVNGDINIKSRLCW
jgi:hypothetical protein